MATRIGFSTIDAREKYRRLREKFVREWEKLHGVSTRDEVVEQAWDSKVEAFFPEAVLTGKELVNLREADEFEESLKPRRKRDTYVRTSLRDTDISTIHFLIRWKLQRPDSCRRFCESEGFPTDGIPEKPVRRGEFELRLWLECAALYEGFTGKPMTPDTFRRAYYRGRDRKHRIKKRYGSALAGHLSVEARRLIRRKQYNRLWAQIENINEVAREVASTLF